MSAIEVLDRGVAEHPDVDTVVIGFVGVCAVACGPGKLAHGSPQSYGHARLYALAFGIASADIYEALSDSDGQWQRELSYDGAAHVVRLDDGVHLTDDGSRRASRWTAATLAELWSHPQVESVV